ncbi:MAG TPA: tRNA epoxyqueuosine(34) reductase QueG [Pseudomonadota bacterium]|nr:tRNA epoxyqueuosine(34) reductase QueG [Pseudomonadota bacterium]
MTPANPPVAELADRPEDGAWARATAAWLREAAAALGLPHLAFTPATEIDQYERYTTWLAADYAGELVYLVREEQQAARRDPRQLLESARCVCTVAVSYLHPAPDPVVDADRSAPDALRGQIARYARATDYHIVLKQRLGRLAEQLRQHLGVEVAYRVCVDTAPLLERALAARAGLGFQGKNTLLITPGVGSYTVLGELLLPFELPSGQPATPHCGHCRACLDVCPTGALVGDYLLDARRCISYLTIENSAAIPRALRSQVGTWIFGCDLCQEVCPWNAAERPGDPEFRPRRDLAQPELVRILQLGAAQFRRYVQRTALRRVGRAQLLRNVAVALGNVGTAAELPALTTALGRESALVREHLYWALGQIARRVPEVRPTVTAQLQAAQATETEPAVCAELAATLRELLDDAPAAGCRR